MIDLLWVAEDMKKKSVTKKDHSSMDYIRRPDNSFMIFLKRKVRPFHKQLHASEITKLAKEQWWKLTEEEHKYYTRESEIEKLKHSEIYPNWKYSPKPSRKKKLSTLASKGKPLEKPSTSSVGKPSIRFKQVKRVPQNQIAMSNSERSPKNCQCSVAPNQQVIPNDNFSSTSSDISMNNTLSNSWDPLANAPLPNLLYFPLEDNISNLSLAPTAVFNEYHMDCGNSSIEELMVKEMLPMFFTGDNLNDLFVFNNKLV
uniref:SexM n=1 Tax=Mucor circinelloides TaxID=36080 RepID=E5G5U5_MUCCI|nr:SexM [Mucor circinelloides]